MMTLKQHMDVSEWMKDPAIFEAKTKSLSVIDRLRLFKSIQETYPLKAVPYNKKELPFTVYDSVFDLVLGQFIMIEQIFTGKNPMPQYIADLNILCLILRPKSHLEFDNTDQHQEAENRRNIMSLPIETAMSILKDFVDDRNRILFNEFKGVFYDPDAEEEEEEEDAKKESDNNFEYKFREQWYWYNIVRKLSNEDVLKYDKVYMLKMETVLPELSFLIQKSKLDKAAEFRARAASKL